DIGQGGIKVGALLHDYRGIITGVPVPREAPPPGFHSRLSATEVAVLSAVSEVGDAATVEPIVQRTQLNAPDVRAALERLVLLGYLVARDRDGGIAYGSSAGAPQE